MRAFIRTALQARVAEGFRYFKLDFLWIKHLETRYDKKKTRLQIRRDLYQLYRESIGEDAYLGRARADSIAPVTATPTRPGPAPTR